MNFLTLADFSADQLRDIFVLADREDPSAQDLRGKTAVLFFPASSIRTRITFERGIRELGGQPILFPSETLDKREKLRDVMGYLENWADLVAVRHGDFGKIREMARFGTIPVINAMSRENHPCEILSDIYAIRALKPDFLSLDYTFVGPRGNILQSWINLAEVLKLNLTHVSEESERVREDGPRYRLCADLDDVLSRTDILLTDPLPESCRTEEYYRRFQITGERAERLPADALINPCPPFYRGEEIAAEAVESEKFVGYGFKKSLLRVQKALMLYCLRNNY
jgi:ornithine carbamoyltransferase